MNAGVALYLVLFVAAALPGVPLGRALFGARHPAAYAAGAVFGYAFTTLALWTAIAVGRTSRTAFIVAWVAACVAGFALRRLVSRITIWAWTRGDTAALVLLLSLTAALAVPPFARVGQTEPNGSRLYRAYFTADFIWHMSLTAEIGKFQLPLRNPYLVDEPIHYYWGFFILPAVAAQRGPAVLHSVETSLKGNAIATGLLFTLALYVLARSAVPRAAAAGIAVAIAFVAASAEGVYETWYLWSHNISLEYLRQTNIDAISFWRFHGLRIDGLPRCLWYVPQHMMAYTAGIMALVVAGGAGAATAGAVLGAGLLLGASVLCNPLVGGLFAIGYAGTVLVHHARERALRRVPLHAIAILPVAGAIAWSAANHMLEGSRHALTFGLEGLAAQAPLANLAVSLGPLLALAMLGLVVRVADAPVALAAPALVLAPVSLIVMHLVSLDVDIAYIGFRTGHILICVAVMLVARAAMRIFAAGWLRPATAVLFVLALAIGLPTTAIDWYNARDTENRRRSIGGFRWTIELTRAQQDALRWLKRLTPATAIVQMEPVCRGRETWSLIPSFAERRMAAGLPISLLHVPAYDERSHEVQKMYATEDPLEARRIAERLRLDYIYADRVERTAYPRGVEKFDLHPELFPPVFANREVTIYSMGGR